MKTSSLRRSIILSVALHLILLGGMFLFSDKFQTPEKQNVTVEIISPEDAEKAMANVKKPQDILNNQIVEQDENVVNQEPPDTKTRFLSAKDQTVKKQTIAVNKGDFENTKSKASPAAGRTGKAAPKTEKVTKENIPKVKDLFAGYDPNESIQRQHKEAEAAAQAKQDAAEGGQEGPRGTGDMSKSNDYVKDVDQGLETLLNTREFKYYSYYNRIRRQLAQHWEGKVREKLSKMYKENRAPANLSEDRITKVIVVLNQAGNLVKVQILSDSGLRDLDDAAVEAFRAAAPFPNPPKGIVESDGTVKIRWDFVLES